MPRIAVDAMGADASPRVEVEGALSAVRERDVQVLLVGDEPVVRAALAEAGGGAETRIEVVHAPERITMHDAPSIAVRQKKQSSMRICFDLVKSGRADALLSAGNSGAMMACGLFVLGRTKGVERPGIVTALPTRTGHCAVLDMGANVDPKPTVLAQMAVLGSVYARLLFDRDRPRVGLLSNGAEEHKGTPLTRETHALLERAGAKEAQAAFDYAGYVEGRDIFRGEIDVVVTDGFTGNIVLKSVEGVAEQIMALARSEIMKAGLLAKLGAMLLRPALRRLKRHTDWAEYGGAPLLGVEGVALICHGGSNATAIKNAIFIAERFSRVGLHTELADSVSRHAFLWQGLEPSICAGSNAS